MGDWQPIETALKPDGEAAVIKGVYLLGFIPEFASPSVPATGISVIWWEPNIRGGCWCSEQDEGVKPSHWMPLPEPPEDRTDG